MNKTFKSMVRKLVSSHDGTTWADWVGEILFAMNSLVTRPHGFTPFRLVYKAEPTFPIYLSRMEAVPGTGEAADVIADPDVEARMLEELERRWREDLPEV